MSNRRLKRIQNEIKELYDSKKILEENGVYFYIDEDNLNFIYAMLIGPEKTPYEKGFYFFRFEYPNTYPMQPPIAKYYTQGYVKRNEHNFNVRFNPNLYTCGKVCLSMLNTWAGPGWVPTNTISNVLIAIQALVLIENPLVNEPAYENVKGKVIEEYNKFIEYANIKISVLKMLKKRPLPIFDNFNDVMKEYFLKNIDYYRNFVLSKSNSIITTNYGSENILLEYDTLLEKINKREIILSDKEIILSDKEINNVDEK
jgi:ubiquitin-protein ligase